MKKEKQLRRKRWVQGKGIIKDIRRKEDKRQKDKLRAIGESGRGNRVWKDGKQAIDTGQEHK